MHNAPNPYARFDRREWDRLADRTPLPLTQEDIDRIASLGDPRTPHGRERPPPYQPGRALRPRPQRHH